jgi:hypothetical protein
MGLAALPAAVGALAIIALPAPAATTRFDCKRVITPGEWRAATGASIKVRYGENDHDCLWFHARPGGNMSGGVSAYPSPFRIWHQIYVGDATRNRRTAPCGEDDSTRTRLHAFGPDFAWSAEHRLSNVPGAESFCPAMKTLTGIDRSVYVFHHGRLLKLQSADAVALHTTGASLAALERLAHSATRRF